MSNACCLFSYGENVPDMYRPAATLVRIIRGAQPADLPFELPTKFVFAINLKTARALRLDLPQIFIAAADEMIE
jgi:putative ABC transport system substrate-binding protein